MFRKSKKIESKIKTGDQFLRDNKLVEAEASYREALLLDDQNAETLYSLGCIANKRNDFATAEAWARKALAPTRLIDMRTSFWPTRSLGLSVLKKP